MLSDINRKRLEWMAKAKTGLYPPDDLFKIEGHGGWGVAVNEASREALDEIARLQAIVDRDIEVLTIIAGSPDRLIAAQAAKQLSNIGAKT